MSICQAPLNEVQNCVLERFHITVCSSDPNAEKFTVPTDPWNEIVPRLFVGSSVTDPDPETFDAVLTLSRSTRWAPAPIKERRFHFNDGRVLPDIEALADAVCWVYQQWELNKRTVLIRCGAGLNRSGLLAALVMVKAGYQPWTAVELLRTRRSPDVLHNTTFAGHVLSQS